MTSQQIHLVVGEYYHVILRGVGDSIIFQDTDDHYRGIFSLYEFNTSKFVEIRRRREERKREKASGSPTPADERDHLVEILAFCFMPNHVHLLVKQLQDGGIAKFMQKFGGGYANYFNKKYSRKGHLFNKFKAVHIASDDQLKNVFVYIHCNPISLIEPSFKERGIAKDKQVIEFLEQYKWSSYQDYMGIKNFPSVTKREFLTEIMGGKQGCLDTIEYWVNHKKEMREFSISLE